VKNIFLFGRPGCGKSVVFRKINELLNKRSPAVKFDRIDDFPILKEMHEGDEASGRTDRFVSTDDGGFKIIDPNVWDEMLVGLNKKAERYQKKNGILAIEFSRPNYLHALTLFSANILKNSVAIYVDASFDTCITRNEERTKRAVEEGIDAHFVSKKEMEETYKDDDREALKTASPVPVFIIDNGDCATLTDIEKLLRPIVEKL